MTSGRLWRRQSILVYLRSMVDVALLELEGVLFDTMDLQRAGLRDALIPLGILLPLDSDVIDGLPPRAAAIAALSLGRIDVDDVLLDVIATRAERAFSERLAAAGAGLRAGARSFVEDAASQARIAIVTRASRSDAESMLRLAELESMATVMICADYVLEAKPSPDGHRMALERLARQRPFGRTAVLALEDGLLGIRAARAAGARCVAVGPMPAHVALEADAYTASLEGQSLRSLDALSVPGPERVQ